MRASLSFFFNLLAQIWDFGTDAEAAAGLIAPLDSSGSTPPSTTGGGRVEVVWGGGGAGGIGTVGLVYSFSLSTRSVLSCFDYPLSPLSLQRALS